MLQKLSAPRFAEAFRSTLKLRTLGWKPAFPNSWALYTENLRNVTVSQWYSQPIFISCSQHISNGIKLILALKEEGTTNNYSSQHFFHWFCHSIIFYPMWDHIGPKSLPSHSQSCLRFLHIPRFGPGIDQSSVASADWLCCTGFRDHNFGHENLKLANLCIAGSIVSQSKSNLCSSSKADF